MSDGAQTLEALSWAGMPEHERIAKLSAQLVRSIPTYAKTHSKTYIISEVRKTRPPHGRGKAIAEAVVEEFNRQLKIHERRQKEKKAWESWLLDQQDIDNRRNRIYARIFDRPNFDNAPFHYTGGDWVAARQLDLSRDKGDNCAALIHWKGHVVCLIRGTNGDGRACVVVRKPGSPVTKTRLDCVAFGGRPDDLVEAAVLLGGPRVRAALSIGKRVVTDWVNQCTTIYHEGQDHQPRGAEVLPWIVAEPGEDDDGLPF